MSPLYNWHVVAWLSWKLHCGIVIRHEPMIQMVCT